MIPHRPTSSLTRREAERGLGEEHGCCATRDSRPADRPTGADRSTNRSKGAGRSWGSGDQTAHNRGAHSRAARPSTALPATWRPMDPWTPILSISPAPAASLPSSTPSSQCVAVPEPLSSVSRTGVSEVNSAWQFQNLRASRTTLRVTLRCLPDDHFVAARNGAGSRSRLPDSNLFFLRRTAEVLLSRIGYPGSDSVVPRKRA